MKKTLIAAAIGAATLLSGCSTVTRLLPEGDDVKAFLTPKPSEPHREANRYDWAMQAMSRIESTDFQTCLSITKDPKLVGTKSREQTVEEVSRCAITVNNVAARITLAPLLPPISSDDLMVILDSANVATNLKLGREALGKKKTVVSLETKEDKDGMIHLDAGRWSYGENKFEVSDKGLVMGFGNKKLLDTDQRMISGSQRPLRISTEAPKKS